MYIKDIHILVYFLVGVLGLFVGQVEDYLIYRLQDHESIICSDFKDKYLKRKKLNIFTMYITALIYVYMLYKYGFSLKIIEMFILVPIFIAIIVIDYKKQIIPNRLSSFLLYIGIIAAVYVGFTNINILTDRILGMLCGGGIFLLITLIGGLIAGKEAMGFGDVKLMAALGLIFGLRQIIMIALISFLVGSVISILLMVFKIKKSDEYIPFGPFIILGAFVVMFVPENLIANVLYTIFTLGLSKNK